MIDGFQRAGLCRGNFFIFKILEGSSHCLERFWARYPISRAEWAGQPFSVVAAWRPFKRAKPAAWDPPPGLQIRACSGRFSRFVSSQTALLYREDQLLLRFVWW